MSRRSKPASPDVLAGVAAGLAAGLVAAWMMNAAQELVPPKTKSKAVPATQKAADRLAKGATGKTLPPKRRKMGGTVMHYATGAAFGALYGVAAEFAPVVTAGMGIPLGLAVSAVADELLVPALGFSAPPWHVPARSHVYGIVSHMLFGAAAETVRRIARG